MNIPQLSTFAHIEINLLYTSFCKIHIQIEDC